MGTGERLRRLSAAAWAGMFIFGIVMALVGAILPLLAGRLEFTLADIGTLFFVMNGAMLASSVGLGLVMDRFGMKPPLAVGPLLVAAALVEMVRAAAFADLLPAGVLLGVGGGALNGATNTLVADLHEDAAEKGAALNLLGMFFGFGALFLPFLIGALLARMSAGVLLGGTAVFCACVGVYAAALRFPEPKQRQAIPVKDVPRFLRSKVVMAFAGMLFFESGVEFTLGGFISPYLRQAVGVKTIAAASWILAGFWAATMVTRIVYSRVAVGAAPYGLLLGSAAGACGGAVLAAVAWAPWVAALAVVACGASLAGVYPTVLGIAGARFREHSGTVFGILFTVALAGGMLMPWAAGRIGGSVGLRWVFGMVAGAYGAMAGLGRLAKGWEAGAGGQ